MFRATPGWTRPAETIRVRARVGTAWARRTVSSVDPASTMTTSAGDSDCLSID